MKIAAIVLCRMDSSRLPGKVLHVINGYPLIWYSVIRLKKIKNMDVIVATTDRSIDDPIAAWANKEELHLFRGSTDNVSQRVLNCIQAYKLDYFFRVNADSPFLEAQLLQNASSLIERAEYDFVTNLLPRSFPYGVSVECFNSEIYAHGYKNMNCRNYLEHPTSYFYDRFSSYNYHNINCEKEGIEHIRLTVDTPIDLKVFSQKMRPLFRNWVDVSYLDAVNLLQEE